MKKVIEKYSGMPFSYGADCCAFVGECLEEMTGKNPMDRFSYSSGDEANTLIRSFGTLEDAICSVLGSPSDKPPEDGDVCLISTNAGDCAAAIVYNGRIVARVKRGLMDYPLERAMRVWNMQCRM